MNRIAVDKLFVDPKISKIFPRITGQLRLDMKKDIKQNGIRKAIDFDPKFGICDGINRYEIAKEVGYTDVPYEPKNFKSFQEALIHCYKVNLLSRELTDAQKIQAGMELEKALAPEAKRRIKAGKTLSENEHRVVTRDIIGQSQNMSGSKYQKGKHVLQHAKKQIKDDFVSGKLKVERAYKLTLSQNRKKPKIKIPDGENNLGIVDLPLKFNLQLRGDPDEHYYTYATIEDYLKDFPLKRMNFAKNCVIAFWSWPSRTRDVQKVIDAYGLEEITSGVWRKMTKDGLKLKISMGTRFRSAHENLIICQRGDIPTVDTKNRPPSVFDAPVDSKFHSRKPAIAYKLLSKMYPTLTNRMDYFGRENHEGWKIFGDQVEKKEDQTEKEEIKTICKICKLYYETKKIEKTLPSFPSRKEQQDHLDKEHGGHGKLPYPDRHYFLKLRVIGNYYPGQNEYSNSFLRYINDKPEHEKAQEVKPSTKDPNFKKLGYKFAMLKDGTSLRISSMDSDKVLHEYLKPGYLIRSYDPENEDYDERSIVWGISRYAVYGLDAYSISVISLRDYLGKYQNGKKKVRNNDYGVINEVVFSEGKIRHLFRSNMEIVKILNNKNRLCHNCIRLVRKDYAIKTHNQMYFCWPCFKPLWEKGKETPLDRMDFCRFIDLKLGMCHVWKYKEKIYAYADFSKATIPAITTREDAFYNMHKLKKMLFDEKFSQLQKQFDSDIIREKARISQKAHESIISEALNIYHECVYDITNDKEFIIIAQPKKNK